MDFELTDPQKQIRLAAREVDEDRVNESLSKRGY